MKKKVRERVGKEWRKMGERGHPSLIHSFNSVHSFIHQFPIQYLTLIVGFIDGQEWKRENFHAINNLCQLYCTRHKAIGSNKQDFKLIFPFTLFKHLLAC